MNATHQRICAWGAPVGVTCTFVGLMIAGLIPPTPPSLGADSMPAIFQTNGVLLRIGALIALCGAPPLCAFTAILCVHMKEMEGRSAPLAYTQLLTGVLGLVPFVITPLVWCAAALRPDRSSTEMLLMSDLGWMSFVMNVPPFMVQAGAFGLAVLADTRERPAYPKWSAYLSFWAALASIPAIALSLFLHGPLAWNGILAFWLGASVFGAWLLAVFILMLREIGSRP